MKLSDVMSAAQLSVYAEVGLVFFLFAFTAVVGKVLLTKKSVYDEATLIPFDGSDRALEDKS